MIQYAAMYVAQIGNFEPEFSTENELLHAMRARGWTVDTFQEGADDSMDLLGALHARDYDFVLWTSTRDLREKWGRDHLRGILQTAISQDIPTVAYHLDRWWGLKRQHMIADDPYFRCDLVVTADGGHQEQWASLGINHAWMPPGVSERWCQPGNHRGWYACDVVFVGSWQHYHREWPHRAEMVHKLTQWFGDRFRVVPAPGQHAIRGLELNDVYWSSKITVGDSCLARNTDGGTITHYCSDRIPETLGRGGLLVHPSVSGVTDEAFAAAPGLRTWPLHVWDSLRQIIESGLDAHSAAPEVVESQRRGNIEYVREHHTYTVRMGQLEELLRDQGLI